MKLESGYRHPQDPNPHRLARQRIHPQMQPATRITHDGGHIRVVPGHHPEPQQVQSRGDACRKPQTSRKTP